MQSCWPRCEQCSIFLCLRNIFSAPTERKIYGSLPPVYNVSFSGPCSRWSSSRIHLVELVSPHFKTAAPHKNSRLFHVIPRSKWNCPPSPWVCDQFPSITGYEDLFLECSNGAKRERYSMVRAMPKLSPRGLQGLKEELEIWIDVDNAIAGSETRLHRAASTLR